MIVRVIRRRTVRRLPEQDKWEIGHVVGRSDARTKLSVSARSIARADGTHSVFAVDSRLGALFRRRPS